MLLFRCALGAAWLAGALLACTRVENVDGPTRPPINDGLGGNGEAGAGSLAGQGGGGSGDDLPSSSGAPAQVEVGLWPTFASQADAPSSVDAVLAAASALSAGSAVLPLYVPWNQLSDATGLPQAETWTRLAATAQPYLDRGQPLALCIGIVDRSLAAWPFSSELGAAAASAAIERTIDEVYARFAGSLSHLCLGYEVDRYLARAAAGPRAQLLTFLAHAVDYAKQQRPVGALTAIGVAVRLDALASSGPVREELALGDELLAVYDPLTDAAELKTPESVGGELDAALEWLGTREGEPLGFSLFEAGYPTSEELGSSQAAQARFFESLLAGVSERVHQVSFIGLFGLADRTSAVCQAEALVFGGSSGMLSARALARCSIGLREESGPRAAWPIALAALSRYR